MFKIVGVDSLARETIADTLVTTVRSKDTADKIAKLLNEDSGPDPYYWYIVCDGDYRLSRGMEDLI